MAASTRVTNDGYDHQWSIKDVVYNHNSFRMIVTICYVCRSRVFTVSQGICVR